MPSIPMQKVAECFSCEIERVPLDFPALGAQFYKIQGSNFHLITRKTFPYPQGSHYFR